MFFKFELLFFVGLPPKTGGSVSFELLDTTCAYLICRGLYLALYFLIILLNDLLDSLGACYDVPKG